MIGACLLAGSACGTQREPGRSTASWQGQKLSLALFVLSHVTSADVYTYLNQHESVAEVHVL